MKKILIIEDELAYVKILRDVFQGTYEVIEANDGKTGLTLALKRRPDLILLDIKMPVMDGLMMLKELRKDTDFGKKVNVVLLTNLEPDGAIVKKVIDDQPTYYWVKSDVQLGDVMRKVAALLSD